MQQHIDQPLTAASAVVAAEAGIVAVSATSLATDTTNIDLVAVVRRCDPPPVRVPLPGLT